MDSVVAPLPQLPKAALEGVFDLLPPKDLTRAMLVCHRWQDVATLTHGNDLRSLKDLNAKIADGNVTELRGSAVRDYLCQYVTVPPTVKVVSLHGSKLSDLSQCVCLCLSVCFSLSVCV